MNQSADTALNFNLVVSNCSRVFRLDATKQEKAVNVKVLHLCKSNGNLNERLFFIKDCIGFSRISLGKPLNKCIHKDLFFLFSIKMLSRKSVLSAEINSISALFRVFISKYEVGDVNCTYDK